MNACRGYCYAAIFAIPGYALLAWLIQLAWNAMMPQHISYWIALLLLLALCLGIVSGISIQLARKKQ